MKHVPWEKGQTDYDRNIRAKDYPLGEPRQIDTHKKWGGADDTTAKLIRRCTACHLNALENFPAFAAAVIAFFCALEYDGIFF